MRIAISGTHRSGKSTLLAELSALLPGYATVDEPYHLMEEEGHDFSHPPSLDDFEAQLERSLEALSGDEPDVLFDRCPVDLVAYLSVHEDAESFELDDWLARVRDAMNSLDLIVFVPIEDPDRIRLTASDAADSSRLEVDEKLRELLLDDALDLGVDVLRVEGSVAQRARSVMRRAR